MGKTKVKYSFAEWCRDNGHEDWLDRWDYELNGVGPEDVAYRTGNKYYFRCAREIHDSEKYQISVLTRGDSHVCCKKCNSIGQFLIDTYGENAIVNMWSDKNDLDPFCIHRCSHKQKVWLKCNISEHPDSEFYPYAIYHGARCKACSRASVITGFNDVATTHQEYVKYFLDHNDAKNVTRWSEKWISIVCPDCGHVTKKRVCDLISYPFNCKRCGDKSTYPNKYMYEFLFQLQKQYNFHIYPEHVFKWSKHLNDDGVSRRIYDFFLEYNNDTIIIEVHGEQHFNGSFQSYKGARTAEDEIKNDLYKKNLAVSNGVKEEHYIVIDARKSNSNWIQNSIMHSGLCDLFVFQENDIDWNKCDEIACKNLIKLSSSLWNDGVKSTAKIGEIIGKTRPTIISYLKKASSLGWCDYSPEYIKRYDRKPILCLDNNIAFESAEVCSDHSVDIFGFYMHAPSLNNAACGKCPTYKNMHFVYMSKDDFLLYNQMYPNLTVRDEYFINSNM